jgi:peptidoglycan/LPS O-acetylase OafA/YrhL
MLHQHGDRRRMDGLGDYAMVIAVAGVVAVLMTLRDWIFTLPFLVLMVQGAAAPGPLVHSLLANRFALFLGRISFALYLSHMILLELARWLQDQVLEGRSHVVTVALYAILPIVATGLCVSVEEPMRRFGRRAIVLAVKPLPT